MSSHPYFLIQQGETARPAKQHSHTLAWQEAKLLSNGGATVTLTRLDAGGRETTVAVFVNGVPQTLGGGA